jgi:chromosome segregation ATPase
MNDTSDTNKEEIAEKVKNIDDKIENFTSILQKFGLDLITKLGKSESRLNMLSDKIDELSKATIDVKSLSPQLNKIVDNQKVIETEIDLLKSLVQQSNSFISSSKPQVESIKRDESITSNRISIEEELNLFKKEVDSMNDIEKVRNKLGSIKEAIFEITGGHRILYEISQTINALSNENTLSNEAKAELKEKIGFWINKL